MDFQSQGRPLSDEGMDRVCDTLGVSEPEVWAVLTVETRGFGFLRDVARKSCSSATSFTTQQWPARRRARGISSTSPGGYVGGPREYERLVGHRSNHGLQFQDGRLCDGRPHDRRMVRGTRSPGHGQLHHRQGAGGSAAAPELGSFARATTAPTSRRTSMTRASRPPTSSIRRYCQTGAPDRTGRADYCGFDPGPIDGIRGRLTRSALTEFQKKLGLPPTGELDQGTEAALLAKAFPDGRGRRAWQGAFASAEHAPLDASPAGA